MSNNLKLNTHGSLWNKWDLHVHTPASIENQYEGANDNEKWERFINDIEHLPEEIKVIGINDYFFIDGYERILHEWKDNKRMQNIELFLPVVEFRIRKFCGHKEWNRINFHVIFSEDLSVETIRQQFLGALSSKYKLNPNLGIDDWNGIITKDSITDFGKRIIESVPETEKAKYQSPIVEGFNNINEEDILKLLRDNSFLKGKYLTAIGKAEWDQLNWGDSSIAEKKTVINSVNLIFCASESVAKFKTAKYKLKSAGVNDLLLDCSDSHYNSDSQDKDRLGNCNTWIKADTTFEGLKQILYEPDDRVCVSEVKPDMKERYQVMSQVILNEDGFWKQNLNLNPNLNTIIGGRSTGKSTLLGCIACQLNSYELEKDSRERIFIDEHKSGVSIIWSDGEKSSRKIDYYPQDYMYSIADDRNKRNRLLEDILLSDKGLADTKSNCEEKINSTKRDISELVNRLFELKDKVKQQRSKINALGDESGITNEIQQIQKELRTLQNGLKTDAETIKKYNKIQEQLNQIESKIQNIENQQAAFTSLLSRDYVSIMPDIDLSGLLDTDSKALRDIIDEKVQQTNTLIREEVDRLYNIQKASALELRKQEASLKESPIYKESLEFQKQNQKYNVLQERLKSQTSKLSDFKKGKDILAQIKSRYKDVGNQIISDFEIFREETRNVSAIFKIEHDGIIINGVTEGKTKELRSRLETLLDQRSSDTKNLITEFCDAIQRNTEPSEVVKELINDIIKGNVQLRTNVEPEMAMNSILSENWYTINYSASYDGDDFDGMSRGKQSFVILKLLLDFSKKACPILIDQPEDSLDNRAIFTDLVKYLKEKKKERQIILVTHNANVVVGADSELIIVANQNGNNTPNSNGVKFQYVEGSLENTFTNDATKDTPVLERYGIREHVCDIVEGGKEAFVKRERKYGF